VVTRMKLSFLKKNLYLQPDVTLINYYSRVGVNCCAVEQTYSVQERQCVQNRSTLECMLRPDRPNVPLDASNPTKVAINHASMSVDGINV